METAKKKFDTDNLYIYESKNDISNSIGTEIADNLKDNPQESLGLIAGDSIALIYQKIISEIRQSKILLNKNKIFLTSEFLNLTNQNESLLTNIKNNFLDKANILPKNVYVPAFDKLKNYNFLTPEEFHKSLIEFGPIDTQLLWIGDHGQIAFNEPTSDLDSINNSTHVVNLSNTSQNSIKKYFKSASLIPSQAISMGLLEIIHAKKIYLPIYDESKIEALLKLFNANDFDPKWPITALIYATGEVKIYLDNKISKNFFSKLKNKSL